MKTRRGIALVLACLMMIMDAGSVFAAQMPETYVETVETFENLQTADEALEAMEESEYADELAADELMNEELTDEELAADEFAEEGITEEEPSDEQATEESEQEELLPVSDGEDEFGAEALAEGETIKKIEVVSGLKKNTYIYGFGINETNDGLGVERLDINGLKLKVTYANGSTKIANITDFFDGNEVLELNGFYITDMYGNSAENDKFGNLPVGTYGLQLYSEAFKGYEQPIPINLEFKVVALNNYKKLIPGTSVSVAANMTANGGDYGTVANFVIPMEQGARYNFHIDGTWGIRAVINDASFDAQVRKEYYNENFFFTAPETGDYCLSIYVDKNSKLSVERDVVIKDISIVSGNHEYVGYCSENNDFVSFIDDADVEFMIEYDDSTVRKIKNNDPEFYNILQVISFEDSNGNGKGLYDLAQTPGEYKQVYKTCIKDLYLPITMKPAGEMPILSDNTTVQGSCEYNAEDYYWMGPGVLYRAEVEKDKMYEINVDKGEVFIQLPSGERKYVTDNGLFTSDSTGTAYFKIFVGGNVTVSFKPKNVTSITGEVKNNRTFYYGDLIYNDDFVVYLKDGDKTLETYYFNENFIPESVGILGGFLYKADKKTFASLDKNGFLPAGQYYYYYKLMENGMEVYIPVEIKKVESAYKIYFDDGEGRVVKSQTAKANTPVKLAANTNKKPGYEFIGWSTEPVKPLKYDAQDEDIFKVLDYGNSSVEVNMSLDGSDVHLYPIWKEKTYKIEYVLGDGEAKNSNKFVSKFYGSDNKTITLPTEADLKNESHYYFGGWYTDSSYKNKVESIDTTSYKDWKLYAKWLPYNYIVQFGRSKTEASGEMGMMLVPYGINTKLPKNKFTCDGYAFVGWTTKELYKDKKVLFENGDVLDFDKLPEDAITDNAVINLYAVWKNQFKVTYEFGFCEGEDKYYTEIFGCGSGKFKPTPNNANPNRGYKILGWYDKDTGEKVTQIDSRQCRDRYLVADWVPNTYTLNYNANGASGKMSPTKFTGDNIPEKLWTDPTYYKNGCFFMGWTDDAQLAAQCKKAKNNDEIEKVFTAYFKKEDHEKHIWSQEGSFSKDLMTLFKNKTKTSATVYALWGYDYYEHTLTLNPNGGTLGNNTIKIKVSPQGAKCADGTALNLSSYVPTYKNHTFLGWYTDTTFKKKATPKQIYTDTTLYAKWDANYTIILNGCGGTAQKEVAPIKNVKLTATKTLPANTYTKENTNGKYKFMGWSTTQGGGVVYKDKGKITNPEKYLNANMELNLYAVWQKDFTVDYVAEQFINGHLVSGKLPQGKYEFTYQYGDTVTVMPTPVCDGYTFGGWYLDDARKKQIKKITPATMETMCLYAKWTPMKYTITFDGNVPDGLKKSGSTAKQTMVYGTDKALNKNGFKIKGYTFCGWSTTRHAVLPANASQEEIDKAIDYTNSQKVSRVTKYYRQSAKLYAVWKKDTYTISLNGNGFVDNSKLNSLTYDVDTAVSVSEFGYPSRMGYTFMGWYTDKKCTKKAANIKAGTIGNKTYYAKFVINK